MYKQHLQAQVFVIQEVPRAWNFSWLCLCSISPPAPTPKRKRGNWYYDHLLNTNVEVYGKKSPDIDTKKPVTKMIAWVYDFSNREVFQAPSNIHSSSTGGWTMAININLIPYFLPIQSFITNTFLWLRTVIIFIPVSN